MTHTVMKMLTSAILALGALAAASLPASTQTYGPSYPVCMHVYGEQLGDRMDCIFTSLAQCAAAASGLPATCLINPYYAQVRQPQLASHPSR
jgi:Protein of unknown function (DUF3551)